MDAKIVIIRNREKIGNILFIIAIALETLVMMTDHCASWTIPLRGRITQVAFALFCIKILTTCYTIKQWIVIILAGILGIVSYITGGEEYVIRAIVMVTAFKDADYKLVLKILLYSSIIGSAIIMLLALMGVCGKVADVRHYGRGMEEVRYCLGFNHPNNLHGTLWYIVSIWILLKEHSIKWQHGIYLTMVNIAMMLLTKSRTGFITIEIVILLAMLCRYCRGKSQRLILLIIAVLTLASSIFLSIWGATWNIYESKLVARLDPLLTGRLEMLTEHANIKEWSLFPVYRGSGYVDNGFVSLVWAYGVVIGLLLVTAIIMCIIKSFRSRKSFVLAALVGSVLVLFMESSYIINVSLMCNLLLMLLGESLFTYEYKD